MTVFGWIAVSVYLLGLAAFSIGLTSQLTTPRATTRTWLRIIYLALAWPFIVVFALGQVIGEQTDDVALAHGPTGPEDDE